MALTILDALKDPSRKLTGQQRALINEFATASPLLAAVPFETIQGGAYPYSMVDKLPGVGFRGINATFTESTGVLNPQTEVLKIAGGDLDVDHFLIRSQGESVRATQELLKVQALSLACTRAIIKGDSVADPDVFDGLQVRLGGNQLLEAVATAPTAGGNPLSLAQLDKAIGRVANPTHILTNSTMIQRLTVGARTPSVGGNLSFTLDQYGKPVTSYGGIPLVDIGFDNDGNEILSFTEVGGGGGGAACTSMYVVSLRPGYLFGIQNGGIDVRDLGELQIKPVFRTRVEWFISIAMTHGRAAARIRGITDAPVTA